MQLKKMLNDNQAIDAIYELLNHTFPDKGIKREPLEIQPAGKYGVINPGPKNFYNILQKLDRKIRSKADAEKKLKMEEIIERDYADHNVELLDKLTDWSRFAIIIPSYETAPSVLATFLCEFGGEVSCHEREGYQAVHLHTSYKDVNVEFQFHTEKHAELKKATDIFYHEYNNIVVPKNSRIEDEKNATEHEMNKYCQMVYSRSDFMQNLPAIKNLAADYKNRGGKVKQSKLKHFVQYISKAEKVQKELAQKIPNMLTRLTEIENIKFDSREI